MAHGRVVPVPIGRREYPLQTKPIPATSRFVAASDGFIAPLSAVVAKRGPTPPAGKEVRA